jgi:hypothetical protein
MSYEGIWSIGITPTRENHPHQKTNLTHYKLWPTKFRGRSRLRFCSSIQKVGGSIPLGVIGIFNFIKHISCTVDSNRNDFQGYIMEVKGGRLLRELQTLKP